MKNEIFPCLWVPNNAKEVVEYYASIFSNAKITSENSMVVFFELDGQKFMVLNGRPEGYDFNESCSLVVNCDTQEEIDYYWEKLTANGGTESVCGWCKDKFGMSWQIVPGNIGKIMADPARVERVMPVLMKMKKLDKAALENA